MHLKAVWGSLSETLVSRSLTCLPYGTLKLFSDRHLKFKTCFLLALASAKRESELHGLSHMVKHARDWSCCTFYFVARLCSQDSESISSMSSPSEFIILSNLLTGIEESCCFVQLEWNGILCLGQRPSAGPGRSFSADRRREKRNKIEREENIQIC